MRSVARPPIIAAVRRRVAGRAVPGAMPPTASVFLHAPAVAFQAPGGGENQLVQTGRHLEAHGVRVRLFSPWTDRLESARLLHLFGMSREGLELARLARSRGVPVVLSPICWYQPRAIAALEPNLAAEGRRAVGVVPALDRAGLPSWRRELLHLADVVLPNSRAEADQLVRLFGVPRDRIRVVPNGVLPSFGTASPDAVPRAVGAGPVRPLRRPDRAAEERPRPDPRRSRRSGLPLVVIGDPAPGHEDYARECRRAGEGFVTWLGTARARRPAAGLGLRGGPGLRAAELVRDARPGRAGGRPGGLRRRDHPLRLDPRIFRRPRGVRPARSARGDPPRDLRTCWDRGPDPRLAPRVATHYLWPNVAQITAEVYDQVAR